MISPPKKKIARMLPGARASSEKKVETEVTDSRLEKQVPASSLASATPQQIIGRLENVVRQLDRLPLPVGETGAQLLEALELTDQLRDRIRDRIKQLLIESPGQIPGWKIQIAEIVKLVRDKGEEAP
jgi:hypothetical protein